METIQSDSGKENNLLVMLLHGDEITDVSVSVYVVLEISPAQKGCRGMKMIFFFKFQILNVFVYLVFKS